MPWQVNKFNLVNGETDQIMVHLLDAASNPLPVAGASAVTLRLKNDDATILEKAPVSGFQSGFCSPMYVYIFTLTSDEIAALPIGADQNIHVKITFGSYHKTYAIKKALTITAAAI